MSLRVLLADESASIKKVFQLGLQDFAADVKTVQSGVDVIDVASSYQPDIIFADILLQKKNGYEVCDELKNHANLHEIPVVLMWSSFMELDLRKYQECKAEGEMEKPFEVDAMRTHIQSLVNKAKGQDLSSFLKFPDRIKSDFIQEFEEQKEAHSAKEASLPPQDEVVHDEFIPMEPPSSNAPPSPSVEGIELSATTTPLVQKPDDEISEITQNSIFNQSHEEFSAELEPIEEENNSPKPDTTPPPPPPLETVQEKRDDTPIREEPIDDELKNFELTHNEIAVEEWRTKDLADNVFTIEEKAEDKEFIDQFKSVELKPDDNLDLDDFLYKPSEAAVKKEEPLVEVRTLDYSEEDGLTPIPTDLAKKPSDQIKINSSEIEAIVRAHAQEIIKLNIQEMLPQIIEKIAREELEKLLKEELKMKS